MRSWLKNQIWETTPPAKSTAQVQPQVVPANAKPVESKRVIAAEDLDDEIIVALQKDIIAMSPLYAGVYRTFESLATFIPDEKQRMVAAFATTNTSIEELMAEMKTVISNMETRKANITDTITENFKASEKALDDEIRVLGDGMSAINTELKALEDKTVELRARYRQADELRVQKMAEVDSIAETRDQRIAVITGSIQMVIDKLIADKKVLNNE